LLNCGGFLRHGPPYTGTICQGVEFHLEDPIPCRYSQG
jgi:hypothetical protein